MDKLGVEEYLKKTKELIYKGRFYVIPRTKNELFIAEFGLNELKQQQILLSLTSDDFSKVDKSKHSVEKGDVYIFGKELLLCSRFLNEMQRIPVYIKLSMDSKTKLVVISLHEQEYPLKYAFK